MQISQQEAAAALSHVESAQTAMRQVVRAHRGHYHLWIWGAAWIAMPLLAHVKGDGATRHFPWICLIAGIASAVVGFKQAAQIRTPGTARFYGMFAAVFGFAVLFPLVLRVPFDARTLYAYLCLVAMQAYVVGGIWTDSYLLWLGLVVTALVLVGALVVPGAFFWLWMAACGGGSLLLSGFYVRHFWR